MVTGVVCLMFCLGALFTLAALFTVGFSCKALFESMLQDTISLNCFTHLTLTESPSNNPHRTPVDMAGRFWISDRYVHQYYCLWCITRRFSKLVFGQISQLHWRTDNSHSRQWNSNYYEFLSQWSWCGSLQLPKTVGRWAEARHRCLDCLGYSLCKKK